MSPLQSSKPEGTPGPSLQNNPDTTPPGRSNHVWTVWSPRDADEAHEADPILSRVWKWLGRVAGLPTPLGKKEYDAEIIKHSGDNRMLMRHYMPDDFVSGHGVMLHSTDFPFSLEQFFQRASLVFVAVCFTLYFTIISFLFAAISVANDCMDVKGASFLPSGFMLISGISGLGLNQTATCLWIETFAVLVGVYASLPIFGAFLLIRALSNHGRTLNVANHVLLTRRAGKTTLIFRVIATNGLLHTSPSFRACFYVRVTDPETHEVYNKQIDINALCPTTLNYIPMNCTYQLEDNDDLLKYKCIVYDEQGLPKWKHENIAICRVQLEADKEVGSRKAMVLRTFYDSRYHLLDAHPKTGAFPTWISCGIYNMGHWRKEQGNISPTTDLRRFHDWEYNEQMTKIWVAKEEERKKKEENSVKLDSSLVALEEGGAKENK